MKNEKWKMKDEKFAPKSAGAGSLREFVERIKNDLLRSLSFEGWRIKNEGWKIKNLIAARIWCCANLEFALKSAVAGLLRKWVVNYSGVMNIEVL